VRLVVVIPGIDPVSAAPVTEQHYAGLDFSRVEVIRLHSAALNRRSKLSRAWFYGTMTLRQLLIGLRVQKPLAVVSMSFPLSMLAVARLVAWLRRVPLFIDVRDLPFDVAREVGYTRLYGLSALAVRLEAAIIRSAGLVFAVSPRFRAALEARGCRRVLYNPIGFDNFESAAADPRFTRAALDALFASGTNTFLVVSAGTLGHVTEVQSLLQAAAQLTARPDIGIVLVGDGQYLDRYQQQVRQSGANVRFLGRVNKAAVAQICRCADAAYYGSAGGWYTRAMLGNKVFDYMGAALPVIYHGPDSAVRDIVAAAECALMSEPDDLSGLVNNIVRLADDRGMRQQLGERARMTVHERFLAEQSALEFWRAVQGLANAAEINE
jgi:glycosyltransferase involved in cell wall biosynthesis